jgi:Tol biopolymer transport system component
VRTGDTRQLTKGAVDSSPIWSPDGSRIAFLRFGRRAAALWAIRADGTAAAEISASGDRRWTIVEGSTVEFPPGPPRLDPETILRSIAWSPDSKRIAFGIDPFGERPEIRIVSLDSETEPTTLQGSFPTWSPSGDRLCIVRATSSGSELLLVSPDGADEETFAAGSGSRTLPSWSPDGDRILFVSDEAGPAGNLELWVADIDGGDPQQLTRDATELGGHLPPGSLYPSWSPDGAKIVYLDEIFGGGAVDLWVAVVDADGGDPEIVTVSESRWPDWQPLPPE